MRYAIDELARAELRLVSLLEDLAKRREQVAMSENVQALGILSRIARNQELVSEDLQDVQQALRCLREIADTGTLQALR